MSQLVLGSPGGSASPVLDIKVIRPMTAEDVISLNSNPLGRGVTPVQRMRYVHHTLARLIADGTSYAEASAITGHSPERIATMVHDDPAFQELIAHYAGEARKQYLDVHSRLAALGMTTIEELQERLEVAPGKFSNKELFALAEIVLDRSGAASARSKSGVNLSVNFVQAGPTEPLLKDVTPKG
jgi:hypothetical protein